MMMMRARCAPGCNDMLLIVPPPPRNVNHLEASTHHRTGTVDTNGGHECRTRAVDDPVDERWRNEKSLGMMPRSGG
jgi:hypothetical protein